MLKILQAHLLQAFFANLKIDAIYALYPEIFGDINLAVQKVFAFSDSGRVYHRLGIFFREASVNKDIFSFVNDRDH